MGGQPKLPKLKTDGKKPAIKSATMWINGIALLVVLFIGFTGDLSKIWVSDPILLDKIQRTVLLLTGGANAALNLYLRYFITSQSLKLR